MKILIIDDEKLICDSIRQILQFSGFSNVSVCYDALQGEAELNKNIYDVAFIDLIMPQKHGNEILETAKKNGIKTEFIVLTAVKDIPMVVRCLKAGAFNYLVKPPSKELIVAAVNSAYEHYQLKNNLEIFTSACDIAVSDEFNKIYTSDLNFKRILMYADRLAKTECNILITGESGVGKTVIAEAIHTASLRKKNKFVSVNINAIPENLFESALFGHKKGAFTGAQEDRKGYCKTADNGTLFLDEIGDLSVANQIKLLKAIEEKSFYAVGSSDLENSNFRLITATSKNLAEEIANGSFRKELFYRINICSIHLPSLKERGQDVLYLTEKIIARLNLINQTNKRISDEALNVLMQYDFPGNFRELQNIIESAYYMSENNIITPETFNFKNEKIEINNQLSAPTLNLDEIKEQYIKQALRYYNDDKKKTAKVLGISLRQLYKYITKFNI